MRSEFDIIRHFFTRSDTNVVLGMGDDAALISASPGMNLAISTDILVSGQHFFADADPYKLGHKSLAVNLSDMAAMGAMPRWVTLGLTLPKNLADKNETWLGEFADGFLKLARTHQVALIGGDTTRGPLNICVQIIGEVEQGKALQRNGARPGDDIWISGHLGDAALVLAHAQHHIILDPDEVEQCLSALHTPIARIALGRRLIGFSRCAIDISDGLVADLGHILACSNVAASIKMDKIASSKTLKKYLPQPLAVNCLLAGGDDYELCFTAPREVRREIDDLSAELLIPLTRIGIITQGKGLTVLNSEGETMTQEISGYDHFSS